MDGALSIKVISASLTGCSSAPDTLVEVVPLDYFGKAKSKEIQRTKLFKGSCSPHWNETFNFHVVDSAGVQAVVQWKGLFETDHVGTATITAAMIPFASSQKGTYPLLTKGKEQPVGHIDLHISFQQESDEGHVHEETDTEMKEKLSKAEIKLRKKFNIPDDELLVATFTCAYGQWQGHLFLTTSCIYFYTILIAKTKIRIPFSQIETFEKKKLFHYFYTITVGIANGKEHVFTRVWLKHNANVFEDYIQPTAAAASPPASTANPIMRVSTSQSNIIRQSPKKLDRNVSSGVISPKRVRIDPSRETPTRRNWLTSLKMSAKRTATQERTLGPQGSLPVIGNEGAGPAGMPEPSASSPIITKQTPPGSTPSVAISEDEVEEDTQRTSQARISIAKAATRHRRHKSFDPNSAEAESLALLRGSLHFITKNPRAGGNGGGVAQSQQVPVEKAEEKEKAADPSSRKPARPIAARPSTLQKLGKWASATSLLRNSKRSTDSSGEAGEIQRVPRDTNAADLVGSGQDLEQARLTLLRELEALKAEVRQLRATKRKLNKEVHILPNGANGTNTIDEAADADADADADAEADAEADWQRPATSTHGMAHLYTPTPAPLPLTFLQRPLVMMCLSVALLSMIISFKTTLGLICCAALCTAWEVYGVGLVIPAFCHVLLHTMAAVVGHYDTRIFALSMLVTPVFVHPSLSLVLLSLFSKVCGGDWVLGPSQPLILHTVFVVLTSTVANMLLGRMYWQGLRSYLLSVLVGAPYCFKPVW